jgi:hypothetical protein
MIDISEFRKFYNENGYLPHKAADELITEYDRLRADLSFEREQYAKVMFDADHWKALAEKAREALEHCRNRPHEHNPMKDFTITHCDVIDKALALFDAAKEAKS